MPYPGISTILMVTVSDSSFFALMRKSNRRRFKDLTVIVKRLPSNLEFTQSFAEYFAMEEKHEPALCVINDALRVGLDLGANLRRGSEAAQALIYRHLAPLEDSDRRPCWWWSRT